MVVTVFANGTYLTDTTGDLAFRTYVEPVPEPGSLGLLGLAILVLVTARRCSTFSGSMMNATKETNFPPPAQRRVHVTAKKQIALGIMYSRAFWCLPVCLALCGCGDSTTDKGNVGTPPATGGSEQQQPAPRRAGGVKYVPGASEEKLQKYLETLGEAGQQAVTDEQVFAIMGEPTRREAPRTGQKDGQAITFYTAHWAVPGSGIDSQVAFVNGHIASLILQGVKGGGAARGGL